MPGNTKLLFELFTCIYVHVHISDVLHRKGEMIYYSIRVRHFLNIFLSTNSVLHIVNYNICKLFIGSTIFVKKYSLDLLVSKQKNKLTFNLEKHQTQIANASSWGHYQFLLTDIWTMHLWLSHNEHTAQPWIAMWQVNRSDGIISCNTVQSDF